MSKDLLAKVKTLAASSSKDDYLNKLKDILLPYFFEKINKENNFTMNNGTNNYFLYFDGMHYRRKFTIEIPHSEYYYVGVNARYSDARYCDTGLNVGLVLYATGSSCVKVYRKDHTWRGNLSNTFHKADNLLGQAWINGLDLSQIRHENFNNLEDYLKNKQYTQKQIDLKYKKVTKFFDNMLIKDSQLT